MKHAIPYSLLIAILLTSCSDNNDPTCSDGILNGTEIGIDCGGNCPACIKDIFGLYDGLLRIRDHNDMEEIIFESPDAILSISSCDSECIELRFQADGGSTTAKGSYTLETGYYSMHLPPVYEIEGEIQSWELDYMDGSGTFNYIDNTISLSLVVSDENSIGNTESIYFYEGEQN